MATEVKEMTFSVFVNVCVAIIWKMHVSINVVLGFVLADFDLILGMVRGFLFITKIWTDSELPLVSYQMRVRVRACVRARVRVEGGGFPQG
jgi:hypothetical protein